LRKMVILRSDRHDIYTEEVNKFALSADDDKRIIMKDGISTLAYEHYSLTPLPIPIIKHQPQLKISRSRRL